MSQDSEEAAFLFVGYAQKSFQVLVPSIPTPRWGHTQPGTPMFIAALFIIARTWKQPRCPSADEWIRKLWYIYTMEYYSDTLARDGVSREVPCSALKGETVPVSESVQPYRRQPTRLPCPWDSPGKNTGVGCHFLLHGS